MPIGPIGKATCRHRAECPVPQCRTAIFNGTSPKVLTRATLATLPTQLPFRTQVPYCIMFWYALCRNLLNSTLNIQLLLEFSCLCILFSTSGMKSAALGAVPVNNLWERGNGVRVYKERISMEHHFDCRDTKRDGYRPRGRVRHYFFAI